MRGEKLQHPRLSLLVPQMNILQYSEKKFSTICAVKISEAVFLKDVADRHLGLLRETFQRSANEKNAVIWGEDFIARKKA